MTPKLTPEQREALSQTDGPVLVEDAETNRVYFLVDEPTLDALRQQEDLAAIREGITDMEAGRLVTLEELDARIRARLSLPAKKRATPSSRPSVPLGRLKTGRLGGLASIPLNKPNAGIKAFVR